MQFLASWRHSLGPDDVFDAFFIANLHAAMCLAKSKGAAVLRAPRVQAVLSAMAQPDTAALVAHALIALSAWEGSKYGARQAWLCRLSSYCVTSKCATCPTRKEEFAQSWHANSTLFSESSS